MGVGSEVEANQETGRIVGGGRGEGKVEEQKM